MTILVRLVALAAGVAAWVMTGCEAPPACPEWQTYATTGPAARARHGAAGMGQSAAMLLFGGWNSGTVYGDTWVFGGAPDSPRWSRVDNGDSPRARYDHAMAWDSRRGVVVLFGGIGENEAHSAVPLEDTWEFDPGRRRIGKGGAGWRRVAVRGPSPRGAHAMCFDSSRGKVVLFGGEVDGTANGEVWEYDGQAWTQAHTEKGPGPNAHHAMAYDAAHHVCVVYGGNHWDGSTWLWNGREWLPSADRSPGPRENAAMAYDPVSGAVILTGGRVAGGNLYVEYSQVPWAWNGQAWAALPSAVPNEVEEHTLVYDITRQTCFQFGGCFWYLQNNLNLRPQYFGVTMGYPSHAPLIVYGPVNTACCPGDAVVLSVGAMGTPPLTYTWKDGAGEVVGHGNPLRLESVTSAGDYTVEASNSCGTATSTAAHVTVKEATRIIEQPMSTVCNPAPCWCTVYVVASGQGTLTFLWRRDGVEVPSESFRVYGSGTRWGSQPLAVQPGMYVCEVRGECGSATSDPATIALGGLCCTADYNMDGDPGTDLDVTDFLADIAAGHRAEGHADPDYNHDGRLDQADVSIFWSVLAGFPCP